MNKELKKAPKVGKNLKHERMQKNMSLDMLSQSSGVSKAMLSQIETNKVNPTLVTLWKISQALSVDIGQIIGVSTFKPDFFILNY